MRELYEVYAKKFIAICVRQGLSEADAWDATQEAFLKIVRGAGSFKRDSRVYTWCYQIVRNAATDTYRKRKPDQATGQIDASESESDRAHKGMSSVLENEPQEVFPNPGETPDAVFKQAQDDCVDEGFAAFAQDFPDCAEAVRHVHVEGLSIDEVADMLGRSKGKDGKNGPTRTFLYECRKKLRPYLEPCLSL
ncbi:MAG: RNA polymerase sigma factor [Burkholderiaceae bacterium]